jgi:D-ribose pyranase
MDHDIDSLIDRFTREQKERIVEARKSPGAAPPASPPRLLNSLLAGTLREVGHTQMLLLADKGFPVPPGVETIDLALTSDMPTVLDVIRAIADEFSFDRILIAEEMKAVSGKRVTELEKLTGKPIEAFPHIEFKHIAAHARLAVRTGDATPYANCLLVCG